MDSNFLPSSTSGKAHQATSSDMKLYLKAVSPSKPRTKMISIDVSCKQHGLIFADTAHKLVQKADADAPRTRSKSKSASLMDPTKPAVATKSKSSAPTQVAKIQASAAAPGTGSRGREGGVKLTRMSRKRSAEVLGALNVNNSQQQQQSPKTKTSSDVKDKDATLKRRGSCKRKRFVAEGDDNEMAAENIPVEAVFPALKFGMNKDISPTKRRRLQSLISPMSPPSPPQIPTSSRFRIARKY